MQGDSWELGTLGWEPNSLPDSRLCSVHFIEGKCGYKNISQL